MIIIEKIRFDGDLVRGVGLDFSEEGWSEYLKSLISQAGLIASLVRDRWTSLEDMFSILKSFIFGTSYKQASKNTCCSRFVFLVFTL